MIDRFREIVESRHQYAQDWKKKTGNKVIGYLCTSVPEEIIYAADMLPVRMMGSHEPSSISDSHIAWIYCPHCRDVLAEGLKGRYKYLDGVVNGYGCNHMRQVLWSWRRHMPTPFLHHIYIPYYIQQEPAKACLLEVFKKFKEALEQWSGTTISEESLDRAIRVYNKNRQLLRQVYETNKDDNPPLSGVEMMDIMLAGMYMDKEEHNQLLEQSLAELPGRDIGNDSKVRLMLIGSVFEDRSLMQLIESLGGKVVIDDLCTGSRYFWEEIVPGEDRLYALVDRCINKPRCPVRDLQADVRIARIKQLIDDYNVQGIITIQQRFCDPMEYDITNMRPVFEEIGIRTLSLELDIINPAGQFSTRIEAFLEMFQLALI